jgi:hypothetical protein
MSTSPSRREPAAESEAKGHFGSRGFVPAQGWVVRDLAEVEQRRLDLEHACPSIWDFCIRILGMSESEANLRIVAARIVRRFPPALGYLERGEIHLCALYALRDYLTTENHRELLPEAAGKTTAAVRELLAARFPRPDVPERIAPVTPQVALGVPLPSSETSTSPASALPDAARATDPRSRVVPLSATRYRVELTISAKTKATLERVKDLMRHRNLRGDLEIILDAALDLLLAKLEKERFGKTSRPKGESAAKAAATPTAPPAAPPSAAAPIALAAPSSLPAAQRRQTPLSAASPRTRQVALTALTPPSRQGAPFAPDVVTGPATTARPPHSGSNGKDSTSDRSTLATPIASVAARRGAKPRGRRAIPKGVRREVFARDGEQCTFVDADGNRCPARGHLELDHIDAWASGGSDQPSNLRVRCRRHNVHHAEQVFGRAYVEERIRARGRKPAIVSSAPVLETVARGLRSLGFREPEIRRVISTLEATVDPATAVETVLREALALLT